MPAPKKYLTEEARLEAKRACGRQYYERKANKVCETSRNYYHENKENIAEYNKQKRLLNKEEKKNNEKLKEKKKPGRPIKYSTETERLEAKRKNAKQNSKSFYDKNVDKIREYSINYYYQNRDRILEAKKQKLIKLRKKN
jgi:hypothetical protein